MTGERWRSTAARELVQRIRGAGGHVQGIALGRLLVTGPTGQVTVPQPENRGQARSSRVTIAEGTGLTLR